MRGHGRTWVLLGVWTFCVGGLLFWDYLERRTDVDALAQSQALTAVEKDLLYRRWVSERGGVYAAVGPTLAPNPYLEVPERDLVTPGGRRLTLVNPAYMTRMVHELGAMTSGVRGHITSLRPLRPENAPDAWERSALERLALGGQIVAARGQAQGRPVFRLMRHLQVEPSCMACHARQGYRVGESRGGISVTVPLDPILAVTNEQFRDHMRGHGILWAAGIAGILLHAGIHRRGEAERERLLEDLRSREARFSTLFGSVSDALLVLRRENGGAPGVVLEANGTATTLLGVSREALLGQPLNAFWEAGAAGVDEAGLFEGELQVAGGRKVPVECHAQGLVFAGEEALLWVMRDISRRQEEARALRKAKSDAEAASRAKGQFLAHMSHEIRTPMNAILGYAQLLRRDIGLGGAQRQQAEAIAQSGEHLLDLLNDVLEMSRIEAGRVTLDSVTFDLERLLASVEAMFRLRCQEQGLTFNLLRDPALPRLLHADQGKIRQVLVNLVGNAVKFTSSGGIQVRVQAGSGMSSLTSFAVEVLDTGPGIPEADMARIFLPFEQTEEGRRKGGTGLGMPISRQFARLLGGDLTVRSREGGGTQFRFTFQAQVGGALQEVPLEKLPDLSALEGRCVLVVDDIPTNRDILRQMLTGVGLRVIEAGDGPAALAAVEATRPDLVLLDVVMPGMNGLEVLRRLRRDHPELPVLMVSASALETQRVEALEAGARGYLQKPFRDLDLFRLVEHALPQHPGDPWGGLRKALCARSEAWRQALRAAVEAGDRDAMRRQVAFCRIEDPGVAEALEGLVERFAYDRLLALLAEEDA